MESRDDTDPLGRKQARLDARVGAKKNEAHREVVWVTLAVLHVGPIE
jgi:hypothetical protein